MHGIGVLHDCLYIILHVVRPVSVNIVKMRKGAFITSISFAIFSNSLRDKVVCLQYFKRHNKNVWKSLFLQLESLNKWLITNKPSLNIVKTEFLIIRSRQRTRNLHDEIDFELYGNVISKTDLIKSLEVHIDGHLARSAHIDNFCKKIASATGALKRIISYIPISTVIQIYHALIQPHFDYCCSVWDELGETLSTKLQKLRNRAIKVMRTGYDTNAGMLLHTLHLDNLSWRRKKLKINWVFNSIKGKPPSSLQWFFSTRSSDYDLRNSEMKLNPSKPRPNYL